VQSSTADSARARLGSISAADAIEQAANGPARRVLIDPLIAREETALLHSQPRDGKTWLMLAAALAVATGAQFAKRFQTVQANVLYCTNEDGQRAIAIRTVQADKSRVQCTSRPTRCALL